MNLGSVSGKNWISKEFNSDDIDFFKTNFFLDETVAKLLSIRKIKKEEVKFFLDPSIKNCPTSFSESLGSILRE